jgi:hypothetical protein
MLYLRFCFVVLVAIMAAMAPTLANAAPLATRESVIRGIPASQAAAVILERRIGNERERQLILQYETRMRDLNREATQRALALRTAIARAETLERLSRTATTEGRAARTQLVSLRAQTARDQSEADAKLAELQRERDRYVAQVEEMMNREASTRAELEAWKQATTYSVGDFSDQQIELLQSFADGFRNSLDKLVELQTIESEGRAFESLWARHKINDLARI